MVGPGSISGPSTTTWRRCLAIGTWSSTTTSAVVDDRSSLPIPTRLYAQRQIQDLDDLRKHFGLSRVTLVAHSYGPLLAASYAIAHPANVKKMIFFGPVPPRKGDYNVRYGRNFSARLDSTQRRAMQAGSRDGDRRAGARAQMR